MAIEKNNESLEEQIIAQDTNVEMEADASEEPLVEIDQDGNAVEVTEEELNASSEEDFYANLAEILDERALRSIGSNLVALYKSDKSSRQSWEDSYTRGLDFITDSYRSTTRPFQGASTVTHPMLSEAVTQFQAQAFKELLPSEGPVRTQIIGVVDRAREEQAQRVKDFMNYELMERMEEYTTDMDQLLYQLPLAGSAFKKIYYDATEEKAVAKFIPAEDIVVPYMANDLLSAERISHVLTISENELNKRQIAGFYRDIDLQETQDTQSELQRKVDQVTGIEQVMSKDKYYKILEMHVDLDLDEYDMADTKTEKTIKVPYIVTVDESSGQVLAIYRNYKEDDDFAKRIEYFVQYKFLPGLGFYGFGLSHMIGGLTKAATNALRQLLDAGTLANLPAGFKARGMRIRDDDQPFVPGEFRDVDAPGGNIRDQFQLLPFREPSATLFQLMGFCVDAGNRFAGISDPMTGDMNSQAPVGTTVALLERGSRVMSGVQKRCYNAMRREFKILARIFGEYLPPEYPYDVYGGERTIKQTDFDDRVDVLPVADPNIFSMSQRVTLANEQLKIALSNPGMHNLYEAYRQVYAALGAKNIDMLLLPEDRIKAPMDPAAENIRAMDMKNLQAFVGQNHDAHISSHMSFMRTRMVQINPAVYAVLQRHITQHLGLQARMMAQEQVDQNPQVLGPANNPTEQALQFESLVAQVTAQLIQKAAMTEEAYLADKKDPLILLKQREIDLKAMETQMKMEETKFKEDNEDQRFDTKLDFEKMKLDNKEEADKARLSVAIAKLQQSGEISAAKIMQNFKKEKK